MVGDPCGAGRPAPRLGAAGAARRLPDAAGRQAIARDAARPAVSPADLQKVMFAGWARPRSQYAGRNIRLGEFTPESCLAVCPDDRLALKIGQFAVAQRALEVIANHSIVLPHIA